MNDSSIPKRREQAIETMMQAVHGHLRRLSLTREALADVGAELEKLTALPELFTLKSFPAPGPEDKGGVRYLLHTDAQTGLSLYLNAIDPGKGSPPHNHMTWAAIVAIEGEELNRVYRRLDDAADPTRARLELEREFTVRRGAGIQFLPDDIHSIHIGGDAGTRHFHLYGRPLEELEERLGFNLQTGEVTRFNKNFLPPAKRATDVATT